MLVLLFAALCGSADAGWVFEGDASAHRHLVRLSADSPVIGTRGLESHPELVVDCTRKRLSVYIRTPGLVPEVHADLFDEFMARTRQKLGSEPAENLFMRKDVLVETMHYRRPKPTLRSLLAHDTLTFAFQPFSSDPVETTFTLAGLADHLTSLHRKCQP